MKTKTPTKERDLQKEVKNHLESLGILVWRNNSGILHYRDLYTHNEKYMHLAISGSPDLIAVFNNLVYGIELKSKKGRQSDIQKSFEKRFIKAGGESVRYILANDIQQIIEIFGHLPPKQKIPKQPAEIPSCGHKRKSHFHAPSGRTLCLACIEKLEI